VALANHIDPCSFSFHLQGSKSRESRAGVSLACAQTASSGYKYPTPSQVFDLLLSPKLTLLGSVVLKKTAACWAALHCTLWRPGRCQTPQGVWAVLFLLALLLLTLSLLNGFCGCFFAVGFALRGSVEKKRCILHVEFDILLTPCMRLIKVELLSTSRCIKKRRNDIPSVKSTSRLE
jgi:hypothetical protein